MNKLFEYYNNNEIDEFILFYRKKYENILTKKEDYSCDNNRIIKNDIVSKQLNKLFIYMIKDKKKADLFINEILKEDEYIRYDILIKQYMYNYHKLKSYFNLKKIYRETNNELIKINIKSILKEYRFKIAKCEED